MESEINERTKGKDKLSVEELILLKWKAPEISRSDGELLSSFENLRALSLINSGLRSLVNFPKLPQLNELELSDNKLIKNLEPILNCPELLKLNLAGNRISQVEALEPLKFLRSLRSIDLLGNPITEIQGYRETLFEMFEELEILDGRNRDGEEDSVFSGFDDSDEESSKNLSDFINDEEEDENEEGKSIKRADSIESPKKKSNTQ